MTTVPLIRMAGIQRTYGMGSMSVQALKRIDLEIAAGEFVAIMGSSGSGKSTLMAILGCLDRPSAGQYFFKGADIARLSEPELADLRSGEFGFVFQSFNLLPRTTALENVELPLFYARSQDTGPSRADRARENLALLGLSDRERYTPGQLSGGQQQRVAIARALINTPSVLLADEPTGNLDTKNSHEIMNTLVGLNRDRGVTVIAVTHEPDIAAFAERVITMRDGLIVSDERPPKAHMAPAPSPGTQEREPGMQLSGAKPLLGSGAFGLMIAWTALHAILRNKMRSALTILGVFIGVAALIAMVAVGQGANEAVRKQIENLGTNLIVVMPGATTSGGVRAGFGSASTLKIGDARAILREDTSVGKIGYLIRQAGQVQYGNQNWTTAIQGVSAGYPAITNWQIAYGRSISDADDGNSDLVAVIGQTVMKQLFGLYANPLGATIIVKNTPLRVIGVLAGKGQSSFGTDQDDLVMIPFSTAERKVLGVAAPSQAMQASSIYGTLSNPYGIAPKLTGFVNQIYVQAIDSARVTAAIDEVTHTLMTRHRIRPGDTLDFSVRNLSQIATAAEGSSKTMAYLLAAVASISLLVGGIGIMNILLVSVTERTREIGLRMAIGARRLHVLLQFLTEAVMLSAVGGVAGIVGGVAVSAAISAFAGWPTPIAWWAVSSGFLFSAAVGIFFGYYPAQKAARLDPIEALRFE